MGKTRNRKRNKNSNGAPFPKNRMSTNGNGVENIEEDDFSKVVADIIDKLESTIIMEKLSALVLLSDMVDVKQIRTLILEHEVSKIVGPMLLDQDMQVCLNAAGALRNLSSCGEEEVCSALVEQDLLTPLLALLNNLVKFLQNNNTMMEVDDIKAKKSKAETKLWEEKIELTCMAINTIWNLCESCPTVLKYVNNDQVIGTHVDLLKFELYPIELVIASGQFIHMLSDDNNLAIRCLTQHKTFLENQLNTLLTKEEKDGNTVLVQVLYTGILHNISQDLFSINPNYFEALIQSLSINQRALATSLTSENLQPNESKGQKQVTNLTNLISAQKLILEFITNLCSSDDEAEADDSMEIDEDDDDFGPIVEKFSLALPKEMVELFEKTNLFNLVFEKIELPATNICEILKHQHEFKPVLEKLIKLQCTAYLCINNLVSGLPIPDQVLYEKFLLLLKQYSDLNEDQEESLTCALRSIIIKINENQYKIPYDGDNVADNNNGNMLQLLTETIDKKMTTLYTISEISKFLCDKLKNKCLKIEENLVKIVSIWFTVIFRMKIEKSEEHDRFICSTLLNCLEHQEDLILLCETLDSLIDVFSDDDTDQLAKHVQLIHKLQMCEPKLKNLLKSNKKSLDREKLAVVSTVQSNLHAFIQYKRNRLQKLK